MDKSSGCPEMDCSKEVFPAGGQSMMWRALEGLTGFSTLLYLLTAKVCSYLAVFHVQQTLVAASLNHTLLQFTALTKMQRFIST